MDTIWQSVIASPYYDNIWRMVVFSILMGVNYNLPFDSIRTVLMYGPTAVLALYALYTQHWLFASSYLLAIAHGAGHQLIPFINNKKGMDNRYAAWPDIIIHTLMMMHSFVMIEGHQLTPQELSIVRPIEAVLMAGMLVNLIVSATCDLEGAAFSYSSFFSTVSVGLFVACSIFHNGPQSQYLPLIGLTLAAVIGNYIWVKIEYDITKSYKTIQDMFVNRYFESLFMFATWFL